PIKGGEILSYGAAGGEIIVKYRIVDPPMAVPLRVTVELGPAIRDKPILGGKVEARQIREPYLFSLTGAKPVQDDIDFVVDIFFGPR
ncbi:hypothetical protein WDZ92_24140, partial [Nostoc sp. NIES-2111]